MSRPEGPLDPDEFDAEDAYEEDEAAPGETAHEGDAPGDGPAPAASLTSLRLTRRRVGASAKRPGAAAKKAPGAKKSNTIVDYWSRLRGRRAYPSPAELDAKLITATWPNAILLRRYAGESGLRAAALYKPDGDTHGHYDHTLDMSPMIVEWMLSLAEQVVSSSQPIAEKESFERPCGTVRYAACALPLGETQSKVDHVLCYLRVLG